MPVFACIVVSDSNLDFGFDGAKDCIVEVRAGAADLLDSFCTEVPVAKLADLPNELSGCRFGDERLTKRAKKLADTLSQMPNVSIPAALKSKADIEACYRFFDNEQVTPEKILQPHIEATRRPDSQYERRARLDRTGAEDGCDWEPNSHDSSPQGEKRSSQISARSHS